MAEQSHLDAARAAYFAAGGQANDPRRAQKVSRIQVAIANGKDGILALPPEWSVSPAGAWQAVSDFVDEMLRDWPGGDDCRIGFGLNGATVTKGQFKAVQAGLHGQSSSPAEAEALQAGVEAVRVKPLIWSEPSKANNGCWTAESIFGTFSVGFDDGWHASIDDGLRWEWEPENDPRSYEGPSTAQAACQAFLDSRILSALASDASPNDGLIHAPSIPTCGPIAPMEDIASDASPRGEVVAWRWRFFDDKPSTPWSFTAKIEDVMGLDIQSQPLYAHPAPATVESPPRRVRHLRRGTEYEVLGEAEVQVSSGDLREGDNVTVYRSLTDGRLWARPVEEFEDGRFEPLHPPPDQA